MSLEEQRLQLEGEKEKALEELRTQLNAEKEKAIAETKKSQWVGSLKHQSNCVLKQYVF